MRKLKKFKNKEKCKKNLKENKKQNYGKTYVWIRTPYLRRARQQCYHCTTRATELSGVNISSYSRLNRYLLSTVRMRINTREMLAMMYYSAGLILRCPDTLAPSH